MSPYNGCLPPREFVNKNDREGFVSEVEVWIKERILIEYNEMEHGSIARYLPTMSVKQEKGEIVKVRPVLDYRDINKAVMSHPGGSLPLCGNQFRNWRQCGDKVAVLDLRKAYLQIQIDKTLWKHQAIKWKGKTFLLTRLGFGFCSAPKIMTKIVEFVIKNEPSLQNAVSSYIDDLYVDESKVQAHEVSRIFFRMGAGY